MLWNIISPVLKKGKIIPPYTRKKLQCSQWPASHYLPSKPLQLSLPGISWLSVHLAANQTELTHASLEFKQIFFLLRAAERSNVLFCVYADFHTNIYLVLDVLLNPNVSFLSNLPVNKHYPFLLHLEIPSLSHFILSVHMPQFPVWKVLTFLHSGNNFHQVTEGPPKTPINNLKHGAVI